MLVVREVGLMSAVGDKLGCDVGKSGEEERKSTHDPKKQAFGFLLEFFN